MKTKIDYRKVNNYFENIFSLFENVFNPLSPNIKEQILLSCPHTFLIKVLGRRYYKNKKIHLG